MEKRNWREFIGKRFQCFTISTNKVEEYVEVVPYETKTGDTYPVIGVGETGSGRKYSFIPTIVKGAPKTEWDVNGRCKANFLKLSKTKSDKPKFIVDHSEGPIDNEYIIVKFATSIGFRGWNEHYGEFNFVSFNLGWRWDDKLREKGFTEEEISNIKDFFWRFKKENNRGPNEQELLNTLGLELTNNLIIMHCDESLFEVTNKFKDWPGIDLCKGIITQGDAGRMGSGEQLISLIPVDTWFTIRIGGRLYGKSPYYIYKYDSASASMKGPYTLIEFQLLISEFE